MSSSSERRIVSYLKPHRHVFIEKYAALYEISESQAINHAVKTLQETMPPEIKDRIMKFDKSKHSY